MRTYTIDIGHEINTQNKINEPKNNGKHNHQK